MDLKAYFDSVQGTGVLATADAEGRVDAAVYARPHVMDDGSLAFIMRDRLTHRNVASNPYATYLFIEKGGGYAGKRLFLKMLREERESELLYSLKRRTYPDDDERNREAKFLVFFALEKELPLIGAGDTAG